MQSSLLSHSLGVEFPELAEAVRKLKVSDSRFHAILKDHDELDEQITQSEEGLKPLGDDDLKELKVKRLYLKDELHRIASAYRSS